MVIAATIPTDGLHVSSLVSLIPVWPISTQQPEKI